MGQSLSSIDAPSLLDAFPEPVLVIDPDGRIEFGNAAAVRLLAPEGFVTGESITGFMPEDERSRLRPLDWLKRWAERPDAPEIRHVHLNCRTRNGEQVPVQVRTGRLVGSPLRYVVMLQDVREAQVRIQHTREAHRLAARMLAISADAIIAVDPAQYIVYANAASADLFGYAQGELIGRPLEQLIPVRRRPAHGQFVRGFADEPRPARLMGERAEIVGLTKAGEEIPLEASIAKITTAAGTIFSAQVRDLRPRKAAEASLRESLASLRTVFDHAAGAMALLDRDGRVKEMNRTARELLPAKTHPEGESFSSLPFWSDDPVGATVFPGGAIAECLACRTWRSDIMLRLPDGTQRAMDFLLSPVLEGGRVVAMIAEAHDIAPDRLR